MRLPGDIDARVLIIEAREHHLMLAARVVVQHENGGAVVHAQLAEGTALHETLHALLRRLRARIGIAGDVVCAPEAKEPQKGVVRAGDVVVLRQERL
jgi:hypothetical protein